ncbi:hypothetical protein Tco_0575421 [Tanacetum coccineum]
MRPFGCPVTILNTLDPLGKFEGKADEGFLVGYSINNKAFRVFNTRTRKVEGNLHINFLENKPNVAGSGLEWLFDIDSLTKSMNYEPVTAGNQTNSDAVIETNVNAGQARQEKASDHEYILLPLMLSNSPLSLSSQSIDNQDADEVPGKGDDDLSERNGQEKEEGASNKEDDQHVQDFRAKLDNLRIQQKEGYANNTNRVSTVNPSVSAVGQGFDNADDQERTDRSIQDVNTVGPSINTARKNINTGSSNINTASPIPNYLSMQSLEATSIFDDAYDDRDEVGAEAVANIEPGMRPCLPTYWKMDLKEAIFDKTLFIKKDKEDDGIFIAKDNYVADILKKFDFVTVKTASTPIETNKALLKDEEAEDVDVHYKIKIGSLCALDRLLGMEHNVYLKFVDQHNMVACLEKSEGNADFHEIVDFLTASSVHYALTTVVISESSVRSDLHFNDEDGITCLTNDAIFENLALMGLERFSLLCKRKGKDFSGKVTPLFASMLAPPVVEGKGLGQPSEPHLSPSTTQPKIKEQILVVFTGGGMTGVVRDTSTAASLVTDLGGNYTWTVWDKTLEQDDLTDFIPPAPYDSPLSVGHTPGSDEGRPNINELMAICINLSNMVLALEQSKTAQDLVIQKLKKKVKRLEKKLRARTPGMKLFKIGTSKRKSLDKEYVSKQGRKSDKTKPMFDDSDFAELDVDNAMENVEGDAKTQGRNTAEKITTAGDTINTASIDVSAAGPLNVSTVDFSTSTAGDIFKDEMMTIADTLVAIRAKDQRTTHTDYDVKEEPRKRNTSTISIKPDKWTRLNWKECKAKELNMKKQSYDALIAQFLMFSKNKGRRRSVTASLQKKKLYAKSRGGIGFYSYGFCEGGKKAASSKSDQRAEPDDENVKSQKIGEGVGFSVRNHIQKTKKNYQKKTTEIISGCSSGR